VHQDHPACPTSTTASFCPNSARKFAFVLAHTGKVRLADRPESGGWTENESVACRRRSILEWLAHFTPRPMQASGILIFFVEVDGPFRE